jgi:hypothetical protein
MTVFAMARYYNTTSESEPYRKHGRNGNQDDESLEYLIPYLLRSF